MQECLGVLYLLSGEWSSIYTCSCRGQYGGNIILPVGEGTAIVRTGVVPGLPEKLVDKFEGMLTSSINVELSLRMN